MKTVFALLTLSTLSFGMSHLDAFNVIHQVASKVPMVAADHAKVEKALGMLKVLAGEKHAEIQKKAEEQKKAVYCKEPEKK